MTKTMRFISALLALVLACSAVAQEAGKAGVAVDAKGVPAEDPSKNVNALSVEANRRQDDLRVASDKLFQAQLDAIENINRLRYQHAQELDRALADKLQSEAKLRAEYADRLSGAEAKRIDAIRAVDVNAASILAARTSEQANALQKQTSDQAEVLRSQVARSAEDLRTLVASTAATERANQQQQFASIQASINTLSTRITALEQAGAEGKGKQTLQDPATVALAAEVRALTQSRQDLAGRSEGVGAVVGWIVGGIGLLVGVIGVIGFFVQMSRSSKGRGKRRKGAVTSVA